VTCPRRYFVVEDDAGIVGEPFGGDTIGGGVRPRKSSPRSHKVAPLGWHVVIYFEAADLADFKSFFATLPTPLAVDHMGRPDVTQPINGPEFMRHALRGAQRCVVKVSACPAE
jgi:hypothetical protein